MIAEECELEERPVVAGRRDYLLCRVRMEAFGDEYIFVTAPKVLVGPAEQDGAGGVACADRH